MSPNISGDSDRVQAAGGQRHRWRQQGAAQQPRLLQHAAEAVLGVGGQHGDIVDDGAARAAVDARPGLNQVKGVQAQAPEDAQAAGMCKLK